MNILLIITPYSPAQTPNTIRWTAIANELTKKGHSVSILTTKCSGYAESEIGHNIYRVGHNTLLDFFANTLFLKKRRNVIDKPKETYRIGFVSKIIEKLVDVFWRKYYWPDGSLLFLKPGKKIIGEIIDKDHIDSIISVGLPFTCHLIAMSAKMKKSELHWHMDIQDPFSFSEEFWVNNFSKYTVKNINAEEQALALADSISVTNKKAGELYLEMFSLIENKLTVIPPILSIVNSNNTKFDSLEAHKIHVAYFGNFYQTVRSPFKFLQFLDYLFAHHKEKLDRIRFHFYCESNKFSTPIFSMFNHLSPYIDLNPMIPHHTMLTKVNSMNFLLNFGNSTNYHLPSKTIELLYFNKPIINVISCEDDTSKAFFGDKVDAVHLLFEKENYAAKAQTFFQFLDKSRPERQLDHDVIKPYLPESLANQYLDLINGN